MLLYFMVISIAPHVIITISIIAHFHHYDVLNDDILIVILIIIIFLVIILVIAVGINVVIVIIDIVMTTFIAYIIISFLSL